MLTKLGVLAIGLAVLQLENVFQITEMAATRGKLGTANLVTFIGHKNFLECWKSTVLSYQIMEMLTPGAQIAIKLHKNKYQWVESLSNETIDEGHSLLNEVLKLICPGV